MIRYLDKITIIPSCALYEMHLDFLIGKTGRVIEVMTDPYGNIKGCWAKFAEAINQETEWYVPYSSIIC